MTDAFDGEVYSYHDVGQHCHCVNRHSPVVQHLVRHHVIPLSYGGPDTEDNVVWVCPTGHANIHRLLWDYERFEGKPPWRGYREHYSKYIRTLAKTAWENKKEIS